MKTMEEYISMELFLRDQIKIRDNEVEDLKYELAKLKKENEKLKSLVDDFILDCERCDRYFQSSSSRNQFQRRLINKKKEAIGE